MVIFVETAAALQASERMRPRICRATPRAGFARRRAVKLHSSLLTENHYTLCPKPLKVSSSHRPSPYDIQHVGDLIMSASLYCTQRVDTSQLKLLMLALVKTNVAAIQLFLIILVVFC